MAVAWRQEVPVDTDRVADLRQRVRDAMEVPPVGWACPERIDAQYMAEPLAVRKARAMMLKLSMMPTDLWAGQLLAGSMTLDHPRLHAEWGFPDYVTDDEREAARQRGLSIHSVFGHIVPDYPKLLRIGLLGIRDEAEAQRPLCTTADEAAFIDSVQLAIDAVVLFAERLAERCRQEADVERDVPRAGELRTMAANLRQAPAGPAKTFHQALQAVWLLHMVFHSTMDGNAMGRLDQYAWPYLEADLAAGRLTIVQAQELVDCFCLKFNERAKTTDDQRPDAREVEAPDPERRTRHYTSSQLGTRRDSVDATNHWLQNIIIGGLLPLSRRERAGVRGTSGVDGANPLTYLLLEAYRKNRMTNPLVTLRVHRGSPGELLARACEVLKEGGGMPAIFNDEALVPALMGLGIPEEDALDYTNDGCWEVIIPGRTDFVFQRLSVMLCLQWALNRGRSRLDGTEQGPDTGDPTGFGRFEDVWRAFEAQLDAMVGRVVERVVRTGDDRSTIAPVPLLSALIDGTLSKRRDMTAGGARFRTFGMLIEGAAHAIDSLTAIRQVVFEERRFTVAELCAALTDDFEGHTEIRAAMLHAPKYGNDDLEADEIGRRLIDVFTSSVAAHGARYDAGILFPCGIATFSWYIGIGQGLGASPDGRRAGEPVSSNFSPALGRDMSGIPAAILSYSSMPHKSLPAGAPLDLRLSRRLVEGPLGTERMVALVRGLVDAGGSMMTLTVADVEELRAAQREPERYRSLRVRMGGWCAYFTMLSWEQQEHHIRRQGG